jgi:hypothetical protein
VRCRIHRAYSVTPAGLNPPFNFQPSQSLPEAGEALSQICVSTVASQERPLLLTRIAAMGKRFVVRADEKLTAFVELESAIRPRDELA